MNKTYLHIVSALLLVCSALCTIFFFDISIVRLIEACKDFGLSIAYYFCTMFGIEHSIVPTVTQLSSVQFSDVLLPENFDDFVDSWNKYWQLWADEVNLSSYFASFGSIVYIVSLLLMIIIPILFVFRIIFQNYINKVNNKYNKDSLPLRVFKCVTKYTCVPFANFVRCVWAFFTTRFYKVLFVVIWLINFNLITILVEFLAYYFYFFITVDVVSIYTQVYKLTLDLSILLTKCPIVVLSVVAFMIFDNFRKNLAISRLRHMEMKNRGFINERPLFLMLVGSMGLGKTTIGTDMALSIEAMFRDKAFEMILENDMKFPNFAWINLENEIKRGMKFHQIYNLATCKLFVCKKFERWHKNQCTKKIFDYDYKRYGIEYDDKLKVVNIWQVLEVYAQLYFLYVIQSSLLISNYSIRTDAILNDVGNFPQWNSGFLRRDSKLMYAYSRHSHILDFDVLRLGQKVLENNKKKDAFEFGIVVITEIGKERGNTLELREVKKNTVETNQKNDGFTNGIKLIRHRATIDNYVFVKIIGDEQRPSSLGADLRDNGDVIHIKENKETKLAMPFFVFGEMLHDWLFGKFSNMYIEYRFARGDNTLLMYLIKSIASKFHAYYKRIYNSFSYRCVVLEVEAGTMDGIKKDKKYYLVTKKIYSNRFSTDCYSDYFTQMSLRSKHGINDLQEYQSVKARFDELRLQNSYFINDLDNIESN